MDIHGLVEDLSRARGPKVATRCLRERERDVTGEGPRREGESTLSILGRAGAKLFTHTTHDPDHDEERFTYRPRGVAKHALAGISEDAPPPSPRQAPLTSTHPPPMPTIPASPKGRGRAI